MANWLSRATDAFRKPPPVVPEPFNVRCDCGGAVSGVRLPAPQRPSCPECGRQIFVLPVNVYPAVSKPKKPKVEPAAPPPEAAGGAAKASGGAKVGRERIPAASPIVPAIRDGILLETQGRLLTPFRLIVVVISLLLAVTAWGLWYRHRVEQAKAQVAAANESGMKALREGDFVTAASNLKRARDAVDLLRRTDPEAEAIRRNCREAVAGNELSTSGLFELLSEFAGDSSAGSSKFASRHRGQWLILDAVIANPDATGQPCQIDMPLQVDGMTFRVVIDSPLIRAAAQREQPNGQARVIFGAPMSDLRVAADGSREGVLTLDGKAAFLWTSLETYSALGYQETNAEDRAATTDILTRQREQSEKSR